MSRGVALSAGLIRRVWQNEDELVLEFQDFRSSFSLALLCDHLNAALGLSLAAPQSVASRFSMVFTHMNAACAVGYDEARGSFIAAPLSEAAALMDIRARLS